MLALADPFDPNTLDPWWLTHEFRVYGDDMAQTWAIVDEVDYQWAIEYRWNVNEKMSRRNPTKIKSYMRRAVAVWVEGVRTKTVSLYLHIEIMKRTGIKPRTPAHCIVDHRDGNTFNCRRSNLRWATHSMNSKNLFGKMPYDLEEFCYDGTEV